MAENLQRLLRHWVRESTRNAVLNGKTVESQIQSILNKQPPLTQERILYRAQQEHSPIIYPHSWFSTGEDLETVLEGHTQPGQTCCVFKIHVMPGVRTFDIDSHYTNADYEENEVLVNGGGIFYKDAAMMSEGFVERSPHRGITLFETWYFPRTIPINSILAAELAAIPSAAMYNPRNSTPRLKLLYNVRGYKGGKSTRRRRSKQCRKQSRRSRGRKI